MLSQKSILNMLPTGQQKSNTSPTCRYCYEVITAQQRISICHCTAPLCHSCFQQELLLTSSRSNRRPQCSVCHYDFAVQFTNPLGRGLTHWTGFVSHFFTSIVPQQFDVTWSDHDIATVLSIVWSIANTIILQNRLSSESVAILASVTFVDNLWAYTVVMAEMQLNFQHRAALLFALPVRLIGLGWISMTYPSTPSTISAVLFALVTTAVTMVIKLIWLTRDVYADYRSSGKALATVFVSNCGPFEVHT